MTDLEALNLRLAVLRVRRDHIGKQYEAARVEAARAYAPVRRAGTTQQTPILPGGIEAGRISIKAGATVVDPDEAELLRFAKAAEPESVEEYLTTAAARDKRVLDLVRDHFPELISERVHPDRRKDLLDDVKNTDGKLTDPDSKEVLTVATVTRLPASGDFSYTPGKEATEAILRALADGTITEDGEVAWQPPAEPGTVPAGPEPAAAAGSRPGIMGRLRRGAA
jgi:hypothetical protein